MIRSQNVCASKSGGNGSRPASRRVVVFLAVFCFAGAGLQADDLEKRFWIGAGALERTNDRQGLAGMTAAGEGETTPVKSGRKRAPFILQLLAGMAGNAALGLAGGYAGSSMSAAAHQGELSGFILGLHAGSMFGSALGVHLASGAGNGDRLCFGRALLGSMLANLAAFGLFAAAMQDESHDAAVLYIVGMAVLPPIGAAIFHNHSRAAFSPNKGNGLFNLAKDKLALGVPDIQIQPLRVQGKGAKPELRLNVRLLSVTI